MADERFFCLRANSVLYHLLPTCHYVFVPSLSGLLYDIPNLLYQV